ncbi:stationary-phase-induced ribosome-associated protein [Citrobacter koseri]|uniref:stationary-phase-induced ribosome-associated protein n=1 Tax=Citrobacter koseri TaxID=545 RepID=UPI0015F03B96
MKSNAAARRMLGMTHWRSNTQQMELIEGHPSARTGKHVTAWVALRTRSGSFFYFR